MDESAEFHDLYLPDLFRYVVPIVWNPGQVGSGVLVNVQGRHFVATAAHCIKDNPKVLLWKAPLHYTARTGAQPLQILQARWHENEDVDIGYLEVADPECPQLRWGQLSNDRIIEGHVQIVGFPVSEALVDLEQREVALRESIFQTSLIEETPEYLKFNYPKQGTAYNPSTRKWEPSEFPITPEGFSGGGCFGVVKTVGETGLSVIEYKLLGIQSCWLKSERYVKAIPIKQWCDLLIAHGHYDGREKRSVNATEANR
jgi:hypothetical protein